MHKDLLKGKYVMYMLQGRKCNGWRLGKVTKIVGNVLTIKDAYKERHRISRKNTSFIRVLAKRKIKNKKLSEYSEEIEWN